LVFCVADPTTLCRHRSANSRFPVLSLSLFFEQLNYELSQGGDEHKFKEISAAYEILSDEEKRKKYDKYGLEGVDDDAGAARRGEDLFSMFFGGGGRQRSAGPRKGPSVNHPIKVSLADLYNGKTVKLAVNRKVISGDVTECKECDGHGVKMEIRQIGPGMVTQMQRQCHECNGHGKTAPTKSERKVLEVHIEKGMKNGQRVQFRGMADEVPGMETGDVNFIVQEKEHEFFKRKGADLLVTKEISLNQALCGYSVRALFVSSSFFVCFARVFVRFFLTHQIPPPPLRCLFFLIVLLC